MSVHCIVVIADYSAGIIDEGYNVSDNKGKLMLNTTGERVSRS
jgi:hypothetical protein